MDEPSAMDDDGEDAMEDYFGMSPDWYEKIREMRPHGSWANDLLIFDVVL